MNTGAEQAGELNAIDRRLHRETPDVKGIYAVDAGSTAACAS